MFGFVREHRGSKLLVLTNFYGRSTAVCIPAEFCAGAVLISNYGRTDTPDSTSFELKPYEALAVLVTTQSQGDLP